MLRLLVSSVCQDLFAVLANPSTDLSDKAFEIIILKISKEANLQVRSGSKVIDFYCSFYKLDARTTIKLSFDQNPLRRASHLSIR